MKNFITPSLTALLLAAGLAVGCDQSASETASDVMDKAGDTMDKGVEGAKDMAGDAMDKGKDMAGDAMDGAKDMAGDAMDKGKEMAGDAMDKGKEMAGDAMEKGKEMAKEAMGGDLDISSLTEGMKLSDEQAGGLLDKVKDMISSGDTDGAGSLIDKLQTMELPASIQPKVDEVKALLDKAKGMGNALQGLGK